MSASHRRLNHLPLAIFDNLTTLKSELCKHPADLRNEICKKLRAYRSRVNKGDGSNNDCGIKNVGALLQISKTTLLHVLDPLLTYAECETLLERICLHCAPASSSALSILRKSRDARLSDQNISGMSTTNMTAKSALKRRTKYLPTGVASLDQCLRGGVRIGSITELVGRAGTGKTQLALQLCVMAACCNLGAVYIDTEKKLNLSRLEEISIRRAAMSHSTSRETGSYKTAEEVLQNLTVHTPSTTADLLAVINIAEEEILHRNQEAACSPEESRSEIPSRFPVGLLVVDSIAAPTRRDFGADSAPQRAVAIFQCAQSLKRMADQLNIGVVVINQVGLNDDRQRLKSENHGMGQVSVVAALGTSWYHCVSSRVLLEHKKDPHQLSQANQETQEGDEPDYERGRFRQFTIVKSNVAPLSSANFEVTSLGVVDS